MSRDNFSKQADLINELLDFIGFMEIKPFSINDIANWDGKIKWLIDGEDFFYETRIKPSCLDPMGMIHIMQSLNYEEFAILHKFKEYSDLLYRSNKEVYKTISSLHFEVFLVSLIRTLKYEDRQCESKDIKYVFNLVLKLPLKEYVVFRTVSGAKMRNDIVEYGDFFIYNLSLSNEGLMNTFPGIDVESFEFKNRKEKIIIGVRLQAGEDINSLKNANELFEKFEYTFSYTTSDLENRHSLRIANIANEQYFIFFENSKRVSGNTKVPSRKPLNLNDPIFKSTHNGNDKIWDLITKKKHNEIEKQISVAIEWIGKGVEETDGAKSFIQFVFAIEALLQFKIDQMVSPSITSQISEWAAFITEDTCEKRKAVAEDFKKLYSIRSKIAHGTATDIKLIELNIAFRLAKSITTSLLVKKPFCDMKTKDEISEYITELKFR